MSEAKHQYVVGFLFRSGPGLDVNNHRINQEVALIKKNKPAWQRGRLNGIGGKIEPGESPYAAMCREFQEETGALVSNWKEFCKLSVEEGDAVIHFFACAGGEWVDIKSTTDELVAWYYSSLLCNDEYIIENLRWLVPLARESISNPKRAQVLSARP